MGEAKSTTDGAKAALLLVVTTALTAAGIWMALNGSWRGYVVASFFGLGVPVDVTQLVRSRRLREGVKREPQAGEAPLLSTSQQWLIDSLASHGALERRNPQVLPAGLSRAQLRILVREPVTTRQGHKASDEATQLNLHKEARKRGAWRNVSMARAGGGCHAATDSGSYHE